MKRKWAVASAVLAGLCCWAAGAQAAVDVTYTLGSKAGTVQPLLGVNAGPLHWDGKSTTQDVKNGFKQIGVKAVRTHDFPTAVDMALMYPDRSKDPTLQSSYNFTSGSTSADYSSDAAIAAIRDNGQTVYLRIWDSAGGVQAPTASERDNWVKATVEVVRHYQEGKWSGYSGLINTVEIGNEPDSSGFWPSTYTKEEFFKLYADTAKAIRTAFPTLKIGGPGVTQSGFNGTVGKQWTQAFLDYVKSAGAPLDFFSWHLYTTNPADYQTGAAYYRNELDKRGYTATELHITEWNTHADSGATDSTTIASNESVRVKSQGAAINTSAWINLQQQGVTQSYFYRANNPSFNDPEKYGLFTSDGIPTKTGLAFSLWSEFAAYSDRIDPQASSTVDGLKVLAAQRSDGQIAVLAANTGSSNRKWTVSFADSRQVSSYPLSLKTIDDSHGLVTVSAPSSAEIDIAANSVQLLTLHVSGASFAASVTTFGPSTGMLLGANLRTASSDIGQTRSVYLLATAGSTLYFHNGSGWVPWTSGALPTYYKGSMPPQLSVPVFGTVSPAGTLKGIALYMGYGSSDSELLSAKRYSPIYTFSSGSGG
jgi:hypothetical protein